MFGSNEQTLKAVISQILERYHLGVKLNEVKLMESWEGVVGTMISKHTQRLYVSRGVLFVKLDSPALKNELSYSKKKLVTMLNKAVGKEIIQDIVFQ